MLIEQTKSRPQETVEIELNMQVEIFSFNPPINLSEERECLLAVTSFEEANTVLNISDEKYSFSPSTPGHWSSRGGAEIINKIQKL